MFIFRMLSLLAGGLALLVPPMLLNELLLSRWGRWEALGTLVSVTLVAASFIFIGLVGHRFRKSPRLRALAAVLLVVPLAGSVAMLWHAQTNAPLLWMSGALLSFTVVLYLVFVFPLKTERKHRPMRDREHGASGAAGWRLR